jgi:TolA-binding protein
MANETEREKFEWWGTSLRPRIDLRRFDDGGEPGDYRSPFTFAMFQSWLAASSARPLTVQGTGPIVYHDCDIREAAVTVESPSGQRESDAQDQMRKRNEEIAELRKDCIRLKGSLTKLREALTVIAENCEDAIKSGIQNGAVRWRLELEAIGRQAAALASPPATPASTEPEP